MTYFFELSGVHEAEKLKTLVEFSKSLKKEQEFDAFWNESDPSKMIDFKQIVLMPNTQDKNGVTHRKFFKRFCKILVTNIIDAYPKKEKLLINLVDKICILCQSKVRLVRYGFTSIALGFIKTLLSQYHDIS